MPGFDFPQVVRDQVICDLLLGADQASFDTNTILGGNIPGGFIHLLLRVTLRSDRASTFDNAILTFNNDTTSGNYNRQRLEGTASTASAQESIGGTAGLQIMQPPGASSASGAFGMGIFDVGDYTNTSAQKTIVGHEISYLNTGSGNTDLQIVGGQYLSTAAITRIKVAPGAGTVWKAGSRFTLYGS